MVVTALLLSSIYKKITRKNLDKFSTPKAKVEALVQTARMLAWVESIIVARLHNVRSQAGGDF